jgi:GAF domain-containing protein
VNSRQDPADVAALTSDVNLAIVASPGLDEMLAAVARRVVEALDVWECDIYEFRPESDELIAAAIWSRDLTPRDREWVGGSHPLAGRPRYRRLLEERELRELHSDDPDLDPEDAATMRSWGERSVISVPLVFQDRVMGALTLIEKRAPRHFSPEDLRLLGLMAPPAAVAVNTARMYRREAEQNRRLQALLSASRAMTTTMRLEHLLAAIAAAARTALESDECAIDIYDAATGTIRIAAYDSVEPEDQRDAYLGMTLALADYPADEAALLGGLIVEQRVSDPEVDELNREWMVAHGEQTSLSVPLAYEGEPIGMLVFVELEEERRFTDDERELATALGEQAAAAIHHARLLQTTERQNRQLGLLLESTRAISSSVELDDVLAVVARTTAEALVAEQCQIQEYDSEANTVKPIAFWQRDASMPEPDSIGKVFSLDDEPDERAFLESMEVVQQLYSDPTLAAPTRATMEKYGDLSYLNVPLVFGGQSFGVMVLVETKVERRWTADEIALAGALAEQAAVAIERARLYKRVQEQAITDGLTGLFNHRYFYERLDQEIARARRYGTPVSLLMVDIDDFKAFNDRNGHLAGDAVLRQLAVVLRDELRQSLDLAARYGGEEFAIILPNTPMIATADAQLEMDLAGKLSRGLDGEDPPPPGHRAGAEEVAERIRRRIATTSFTGHDGAALSRITVSIGVAVFLLKTASVEDLVSNADAALYKAKRGGKDRVESYG